MTTIAATVDMMAADTKVCAGDTSAHYTHKLYRVDDAILGPTGHTEACKRFVEWWMYARGRPLRIPKRLEFEALVLTHEGLFRFEHRGPPELMLDGYGASGSGWEIARAALETMVELGRNPDPRVAVRVACRMDNRSGGNVESLRLRKKR